MERAKSDVVKDQDNENYKKVYVQWWEREPIMMRNCIIIVGWISGSVIM
jgi:hypothetical protein